MAANIMWARDDIRQLKSLYEEGRSTTELARTFGCSSNAIAAVLRTNGVTLRPRGAYAANDRLVCPSFRLMCNEAATGSAMLLEAIQRAGVRP